MSTEGPGKSALWAKVFAAFILLVPLPLGIWFMVSLSKATIPW
ncbi:hypothetical protein [Streptomyces montanisoli]|nr:hypothetical protein [Streptomyces montanisoli]